MMMSCSLVKSLRVPPPNTRSIHPVYDSHYIRTRRLGGVSSSRDEIIDGDNDSNGVLESPDEENKRFLFNIQRYLVKNIIPKLCTPADDVPSEDSSNMISQDSPLLLLLAVSGGCDSIALFHSMIELSQRQYGNDDKNYGILGLSLYNHYSGGSNQKSIPIRIEVVHFDHCQRGEDSDNDRIFVQNLCKEYNVPFHSFSWNSDDTASFESFSQDIARDWRRGRSMELFKNITSSQDKQLPGMILTAHHKDDSEETLLLKLLRGVHITNISGMSPTNEHKYNEHTNILFGKPLLDVRKEEIIRYLKNRGLAWREDSSNASNKYKRNRVRNELIPLIKEMVGGGTALEKRFANLEEQSQKIHQDIASRTDEYLQKMDPSISDFPLPQAALNLIEEEALHRWIISISNGELNLGYEKFSILCKQISTYPDRRQWNVEFGSGWSVERNGDVLQVYHDNMKCVKESISNRWRIQSDKGDNDDDRHIHLLDLQFKGVVSNEYNISFNLKVVGGNEKMTFSPSWRKGKSPIKVKEFLRGQKVPLHRRDVAPILMATIGNTEYVCAVFVEDRDKSDPSKGKWITNADFEVNDIENSIRKQVILQLDS